MSQTLPVTANLPAVQIIPLQIVSPSTIPGGGGNTSNTVAVVSGNSAPNSTPNNATTPGSAQLSAVNPGSIVSSSQNQNTRLKSTSRFCSSGKIAALAAIAALATGVYYFYDQHYFSTRTWNLGVWKDCHGTDLPEISTSATCQRYKNLTYEDLVGRSMDVPPQESPTTISAVVKAFLRAAFTIIDRGLWLGVAAAFAFHVLASVCDMTTAHYILNGGLFVGSLWISSITLAMQLSHPVLRGLSWCTAGLLTYIYRSSFCSATNVCIEAVQHDKPAKERRFCGTTRLVCSPTIHLLLTVGQLYSLAEILSRDVSDIFSEVTVLFYKSTLIWLIILLIGTQFIKIWIIPLGCDFRRDLESLVFPRGVSHQDIFLVRMNSAPVKVSHLFKYLIGKKSKGE